MPGSAHGPGEAVQLPSSVCQSIKVVVLEEEEDDDMRASLIRRSKGWKKQRGKERWPELPQRQANDVQGRREGGAGRGLAPPMSTKFTLQI